MAHKSLRGRKGRASAKLGSVRKELKNTGPNVKKKGKTQHGGKEPQEKQALPVAAPSGEQPKLTKKEAKAKESAIRTHQLLYSDDDTILLVGEGNFSFARALCEHLQTGTGVVATAFDGEAALNKKYADANSVRQEIEDKFNGVTLVGVDATRLHEVKQFRKKFTKIVWNFPHLGSGESDVEKGIAEHQKLLTDFFASAKRCLDPGAPNAAVHVALKVGEPYKSWKVVKLASQAAEFELKVAPSFMVEAWPGYAHRRTVGFSEYVSKADSEELAKGAKVYVFRPAATK